MDRCGRFAAESKPSDVAGYWATRVICSGAGRSLMVARLAHILGIGRQRQYGE